ncbi:J domain-containing protein [Durusdinium trenchii]|uniref:J domain-containing protein n=1 Tax=Durusdinium trenchii TaxID=1381693 RepID=A0ABP0S673_9DINO
MMKWYWRQVNSDADECQNLLEGPLSKFTKIGPSGNLRLTHAWMEGHGNDFFLTLSTCCAFKFRLAHFHPQGLLLRRSCGTPDWLLCRFTRTEAPLIVTVDLQRGINETHVQCTLPSGTFVFDKVLSNSKTWWNLVTEMGASDVNVANVMMFLETKEIHRMFWNQRIIEQVQDINSKTMWEDLFATKESPQKVQAKKIAQKTKDHENKSKVEADEKAKVKKPPAMKVLKKPKTKDKPRDPRKGGNAPEDLPWWKLYPNGQFTEIAVRDSDGASTVAAWNKRDSRGTVLVDDDMAELSSGDEALFMARETAYGKDTAMAGPRGMFFGRGLLDIYNAAMHSPCEEDADDFGGHTLDQTSACIVSVSGMITTFDFVGALIALLVSECPEGANIKALCASDCTILVGAVSGLLQVGTSMLLVCGKTDEHIDHILEDVQSDIVP